MTNVDPSTSKVIVDLLDRFGIGLSFIIMVGLILWRYLPKFLDLQVEKMKHQQQYDTQRQQKFDEQIGLFGKLVEQTNQVIAQSTSVIERNNVIFQEAITTNKQVIQTLVDVVSSINDLSERIERHDQRSEKMSLDIVRIAAKLDIDKQPYPSTN